MIHSLLSAKERLDLTICHPCSGTYLLEGNIDQYCPWWQYLLIHSPGINLYNTYINRESASTNTIPRDIIGMVNFAFQACTNPQKCVCLKVRYVEYQQLKIKHYQWTWRIFDAMDATMTSIATATSIKNRIKAFSIEELEAFAWRRGRHLHCLSRLRNSSTFWYFYATSQATFLRTTCASLHRTRPDRPSE